MISLHYRIAYKKAPFSCSLSCTIGKKVSAKLHFKKGQTCKMYRNKAGKKTCKKTTLQWNDGGKETHEDYIPYIGCICRTVFLFLFCHCFMLKYLVWFHLCLVSVLLLVHSYLKCSFAKTFCFSFYYFFRGREGRSLETEQWPKWLNHLWRQNSQAALVQCSKHSYFPNFHLAKSVISSVYVWPMDSKMYASDLCLTLELFRHVCTTPISCPITSELYAVNLVPRPFNFFPTTQMNRPEYETSYRSRRL